MYFQIIPRTEGLLSITLTYAIESAYQSINEIIYFGL